MSANPDEIPRELGDIDGFTELQGPRGNKRSTEFTRRRGDERVINVDLNVENAGKAELDEATRIVGCRRETVPEEEGVIATPPYPTRVTAARYVAEDTKHIKATKVVVRSVTEKQRQPFAHLGIGDSTNFFGRSWHPVE